LVRPIYVVDTLMPETHPTLPLGPFRGINNVDDELSLAYSVTDQPAYLRQAVNVDLTRDGWVRTRTGQTKLLSLTDAHSLCATSSGLYFVDSGSIYRVNPDNTATEIVSGLSNSPMSFADIVGTDVFYCNGSNSGRITWGQSELSAEAPNSNFVSTFWGLTPPSRPVLSITSGNLPAGEYQVALTCESADGIESGATRSSVVSLASVGGILVQTPLTDANAAYVNVYLSSINGSELFWTQQSPVGQSITITQPPVSRQLLSTFNFYPPPQGARIVKNFRGRLLVVAGNALYWSQPLAPHWFRLSTDVQLFSEPPVMLETVADGFYLAEGERTWWITGDDPANWQPTLVDSVAVCAGPALQLPGRKIPALETMSMVAVWAGANGPVVGLPNGAVVHLTDRTVAMDSHANAALTYREENGLSQLLMNLRNKENSSRFGATDRATCTVIKANQTTQ
jgi:hypothetical protein